MSVEDRSVEDKVREVLRAHGSLGKDVAQLSGSDDLYQSGLSSHASVNVMLGLEGAFDIEFPDHMLKRNVFMSIDSMSAAVRTLLLA